jgi:hypothetical protein
MMVSSAVEALSFCINVTFLGAWYWLTETRTWLFYRQRKVNCDAGPASIVAATRWFPPFRMFLAGMENLLQ